MNEEEVLLEIVADDQVLFDRFIEIVVYWLRAYESHYSLHCLRQGG